MSRYEPRRLRRIHQQFQFRKLEHAAGDIVAGGFAAPHLDVHTETPQQFKIIIYTLALSSHVVFGQRVDKLLYTKYVIDNILYALIIVFELF